MELNAGRFGRSLVLDVGGVAGTDGSGVVVGFGVYALGLREAFFILGLRYRHAFTTGGNRHELLLDILNVPF